MVIAGFSIEELREGGHTLHELCNVGADLAHHVSVFKLQEGGYTPIEFRAAGYGAADLLESKVSIEQLRQAGFTAPELRGAGCLPGDLRRAGFRTRQLKTIGCTAEQFRTDGFSAGDLRAAGEGGRTRGEGGSKEWGGNWIWRGQLKLVRTIPRAFFSRTRPRTHQCLAPMGPWTHELMDLWTYQCLAPMIAPTRRMCATALAIRTQASQSSS